MKLKTWTFPFEVRCKTTGKLVSEFSVDFDLRDGEMLGTWIDDEIIGSATEREETLLRLATVDHLEQIVSDKRMGEAG